jgi:hypothetical protein
LAKTRRYVSNSVPGLFCALEPFWWHSKAKLENSIDKAFPYFKPFSVEMHQTNDDLYILYYSQYFLNRNASDICLPVQTLP